jgi:hypothetical protein
MTKQDRCRLLSGPYTPPAARVGDRATCLFRDCDVVITSWSDGRISWPRFRPLETNGGGTSLLVNEELARAIRHESALAVRYWWGVDGSTVWRWRKAFGVGRADSEGSRRLIQAAADAGAKAIQRHEWTAAEREQRRQRSKALNLARSLKPGYHGRVWSAEELALLGSAPDEEIAARIGRTSGAVRQARTSCGIPDYNGHQWTEEELALLGMFPDEEVAARIGRNPSAVRWQRTTRGVPTAIDRRKKRTTGGA